MHSYGGSGEPSGRSRNRGTPSPYSNESSSLLLPDGSSSEDELAGTDRVNNLKHESTS